MKKFYKTTQVMGIATFTGMVIGLLRAKFLALTLGPAGVGIFSQAMTFFQSADAICGLGICLGVTKYISEMWQKQRIDEVKKILSSSFILQSMAFLIFFISVLIFSRELSQFMFSSTEYSWFLIIVAAGVLFTILVITLESAFLGLARPDLFSKARIVCYIASLLLLVLFVGAMKLRGAFLYILINAIVSFFIVFILFAHTLKSKIKISIDFKSYSGKLLSYGAATLGSVALSWLALLYIRSILIKELGISANGYYQVVFALVGYYTPFFTNGMWGYLFPKLSAISDTSHFNIEINKAMRFILIFLIPSIAILFLFRKALVLIIFSREFLPALHIFSLYLLGSLFFMLSYLLGCALLAKKRLKTYFSINIFQNFAFVLMFMLLAPRMGLMAVALSYLAVNIFASFISAIYQINRMNLVFNKANTKLFIIGILFVLIIFFIPWESIIGLTTKGLLVIFWFLFAIGKREIALFRSSLRAR